MAKEGDGDGEWRRVVGKGAWILLVRAAFDRNKALPLDERMLCSKLQEPISNGHDRLALFANRRNTN